MKSVGLIRKKMKLFIHVFCDYFSKIWKKTGRSLKKRKGRKSSNEQSSKRRKVYAGNVHVLCEVEAFLNHHYLFRFNKISEMTEFKKRDADNNSFRGVGRRELNSLCIAARKNGVDCWDRDVARYVHSEDIEEYHPFYSYMEQLPEWDRVDRVSPLARRVSDRIIWIDGFHRWMLGMAAQWMGFDALHGNSVAPVLISREQGNHKSTFCKSLIPDELRAYYSDSFDITSAARAEQKMSAFGLINLDELDKFSPRKMALLKNLMQMAEINICKAYRTSFSALPRMASFIATSNRKDLLTDPTGSRRFFMCGGRT